jgi:hypothetical protein
VEPSRGTWDFKLLDRYVALAEDKNVELLLPLGLSPTWASSRPAEPSAYQRPGWAAEPRNREDWRNYVRTVARRYKGRIGFYEIWNEPNLFRFFSGTPEAMRTLACDAYHAIKEVDPAAKVVSPSPTEKEEGVAWLDTFFELGGGQCADIIGFHFYVYAHEPPELIADLIGKAKAVMSRHGLLGLELWNTETGWYFANLRVPPRTRYKVQTHSGSASYVARAMLVAAANGVSRFFWYAWDNASMGGLIEPDTFEAKPAAHAYRQLFRWLVGSSLRSCAAVDASVWRCVMVLSNGDKAEILWSVSEAKHWVLPRNHAYKTFEPLLAEPRLLASGGASAEVTLTATPVLLR